jgi:DNA-binding MarR family transcriptional regulator
VEVPVSEPEEAVGYLLTRIAHVLGRRWSEDLRAYGVTARQHGALAVLAARPGISAGELARAVMITPQSTGELLDGLVARGLIERQEPAGRGRAGRLTLTAAGRRVLGDTAGVVAASNAPAALGLTAREADQLRALLTKVLHTVG